MCRLSLPVTTMAHQLLPCTQQLVVQEAVVAEAIGKEIIGGPRLMSFIPPSVCLHNFGGLHRMTSHEVPRLLAVVVATTHTSRWHLRARSLAMGATDAAWRACVHSTPAFHDVPFS